MNEEFTAETDASTYEFRWDVPVDMESRKFGTTFMKQFRRVLQAQKMTPLVTAALAPRQARFQLCLTQGEANTIQTFEAQVQEELQRLRWSEDAHISGEPSDSHPAGWQGVRLWLTFARADVEAALAKKIKTIQ